MMGMGFTSMAHQRAFEESGERAVFEESRRQRFEAIWRAIASNPGVTLGDLYANGLGRDMGEIKDCLVSLRLLGRIEGEINAEGFTGYRARENDGNA